MIEIIDGDLLDAPEKYILHQTNSISTGKAAGIARAIFDKFPYADCYADRKEQVKPGTIDIRGDGIKQRFVINLHGQLYPGKSKYPQSGTDGIAAREKYFYHGLLRVAKISNLESIAINYGIGCGLAGGSWERYLGQLKIFADHLEKDKVAVRLYRKNNDQ
jgi:O-acetyl-ADP-ribose deacetylase (regulator of RNase III)